MQSNTPRFDVRDYFRIAQKRKWFIILVGLAAMLIGGLYAISYPKSYRATALILVQQRQAGVVWLTPSDGRGRGGGDEGTIALETQASMIMGNQLAEKVAAALKEKRSGERVLTDAQEVQSSLTASTMQPDRIRIEAESPIERNAIAFAKEAADQFVIMNTEFKRAQDRKAREYLEEQLERTQEGLAQISDQIMEFQNRTGVYTDDAGAASAVEAMNRYQAARADALAELAAVEAQLQLAESMLSRAKAGRSKTQTVPNPTVSVLQNQLITAEVTLAELRTRYTDSHPAISETKARVTALKDQIKTTPPTIEVPYGMVGTESATLAERRVALLAQRVELQARIRAIENVERQVNAQAAGIPAKQAALSQLRARSDLLRQTHERILEELENRRLSEEAKSGTAMVFDSPTRAVSTRPSVSRGLLFAGVLGLVAGIALALVLEALDDTVHTPEDITREIDINFLGMVPLLDTGVNELITVSAPKSPPAEAYRTLRSNINFGLLEDPASMFLITSAGSGEGKTVTASNIAVVFAQAGQSVIVVDTDLRRPTLHRLLHGDSSRGLTNILVGEASIEDVLQDTHVEGLKLISSGPLPPNPAEMLDSDPMRRLIQDLKEYADIVIFDSPPAIVLTDAVVLSSKVERTILVAEAGQVTKEAFGEAVRLIRNARGNLLGVVLNKLRLSASDYYYYYYYYDYSHENPRVIAPPGADTEV